VGEKGEAEKMGDDDDDDWEDKELTETEGTGDEEEEEEDDSEEEKEDEDEDDDDILPCLTLWSPSLRPRSKPFLIALFNETIFPFIRSFPLPFSSSARWQLVLSTK
jgi:hypothetical protein